MRRTKIIATLGPATSSTEVLETLIDAGLNIARLNMSHAPHDWVRATVDKLRSIARSRGIPLGILMDTQGPAIRTGDLTQPIELKPGNRFTFTVRGEKGPEGASVEVNYEGFIDDVSVGNVILIDNGALEMKVLSKTRNRVECEVLTSGSLGSRRHINLPGVKVNLPALTEKDHEDIALGLELGVDFIALSFVREVKDIEELRQVISKAKYPPIVVAKIEDQQAVKSLPEIIAASDAVMVARGDLGIECPYEELPIIQRKVVKECLRIGRPVIVATHMLESMIENPRPTRAEITDVANAVYEQSDAVMLSGETTVGRYPRKCIEVLDRIAQRTERSGGANFHHAAELTSPRQKLAKSAVVMADELKAVALIVVTVRGNMARYVGWMRPRYSPIFAICESPIVANALTINWGIQTRMVRFNHEIPERTVTAALALLQAEKRISCGDWVVIVSSVSADEQLVDAVQMRKVL